MCVCVCLCVYIYIPSLGALDGGFHGILEDLEEGVVEVGRDERGDRTGVLVYDVDCRDSLQEVVLADAVDFDAAVCVCVCVCVCFVMIIYDI